MENENIDAQAETVVKEETTKTYTQEDIDNSFNAGVKKAKIELQKDKDYKEFFEWKKTHQSQEDKLTELTTNNASLISENKMLKAQIEVSNSDVKKEFVKFVTSEVMGLVNEDKDFEKALKDFKKDNPQYFGEVVVKKVQSSPAVGGGDEKPRTTNDTMNDLIRGKRNV